MLAPGLPTREHRGRRNDNQSLILLQHVFCCTQEAAENGKRDRGFPDASRQHMRRAALPACGHLMVGIKSYLLRSWP